MRDAPASLRKSRGADTAWTPERQIPGISALSAHALIGEIGTTLDKFPSVRHFASWLGLCPDNRVSGGTVLSSKTRDVPSRAAQIFRIAAQSLHAAKSALGEHFRKMRGRIGAPEAITATAHKLARIYYAVLKTRTPYDEPSEAR